MPEKSLWRAAMLMLVLVVLVIGGWEIYLRSGGVTVSYDNGKELWADKRAMVYEPTDKATVFLGSSRIKYDLDIPTWEQTTGRHAIQLAAEGSSPLPILIDLGKDPRFKGELVVDITEEIFFSAEGPRGDRQGEYLAYYKSRTPAQRVSFMLDRAVESQFVFLDDDFLSLNGELDKHCPLPNRTGVFVFPLFPKDFQLCQFDRQNKMSPAFLADTSLQGQVQRIWLLLMGMAKNAPRPAVDPVPEIMQDAVAAVDSIRARGGDVVFIRTPSVGPMFMIESHAFPRAKYWDPLLAATHSNGIYFLDHPETAHFVCPEWSHLKPADAIAYTKALVPLLPKTFVQ
jgi:hypothetical protein